MKEKLQANVDLIDLFQATAKASRDWSMKEFARKIYNIDIDDCCGSESMHIEEQYIKFKEDLSLFILRSSRGTIMKLISSLIADMNN